MPMRMMSSIGLPSIQTRSRSSDCLAVEDGAFRFQLLSLHPIPNGVEDLGEILTCQFDTFDLGLQLVENVRILSRNNGLCFMDCANDPDLVLCLVESRVRGEELCLDSRPAWSLGQIRASGHAEFLRSLPRGRPW